MNDNDLQGIDRIFKQFNSPIWIVTTADGDEKAGLTATWVHCGSIDAENPTVLIGLAPNHYTATVLARSGCCVIHLLRPDQTPLALEFARPSSRTRDKFQQQDWDWTGIPPAGVSSGGKSADDSSGDRGPLLESVHSAFACRTITSFNAGDRIYFLADIVSAPGIGDGPIMRESDFFGACTPEDISELVSGLQADIGIQRLLLAEWKKNLNP